MALQDERVNAVMKSVRLNLHSLPEHSTSPLGAPVAILKGDALVTLDVGRLPLSMRPWSRSTGSAWRASTADARSKSMLRTSLGTRNGDQRALLVLGRCTTLQPATEPAAAASAAQTQALVKDGPQAYYIVLLNGLQLAVWQLFLHGPAGARGRGGVDMAFFPKAAAVPAQRAGKLTSPEPIFAHASTRRRSTSLRSSSPPPVSAHSSTRHRPPSQSASVPASASAARPQPDTSTASTTQKNALKRMIVTSLRLRGIERPHPEFRDLYTNTLQAASFALRRLGAGADAGTGAASGARPSSRAQKDAVALWERKAVVHVENLLQMFLS